MINKQYFTLANGIKIPKIGFGTWQISDYQQAYESVKAALVAGYRHIDTAMVYLNEAAVGQAIKDSGIAREKLFITSKLNASKKGYQIALDEFSQSLKRLGLDYLDLYLIHAPWPWDDIGSDHTKGNIDSWIALIELYNRGKVKAIGVSNFEVDHLKTIIDATGFIPHVNQIPFYIGRPQNELRHYCKVNNILVEAYSPLVTGKIFNVAEVVQLANKYQVSVAQLAIRYCLDMHTLPLPKSVNRQRIKENRKVDFKISAEDLSTLHRLVIDYKK